VASVLNDGREPWFVFGVEFDTSQEIAEGFMDFSYAADILLNVGCTQTPEFSSGHADCWGQVEPTMSRKLHFEYYYPLRLT